MVQSSMAHSLKKIARGAALSMLAAATWLGMPGVVQAADSAIILMYHRFGENRFPSTNIRLEQLENHIKELTSGPYTVLPVPEIVAALRAGREPPGPDNRDHRG